MKTLQPRIENRSSLQIAGFRKHFPTFQPDGIPSLWQRLGPYLGAIPNQVGRTAYGVCFENTGIDYLSGVEVVGTSSLPADFAYVSIAAQCYVFSHDGHVSEIHFLLERIWKEWAAQSPERLARPKPGGVLFFESYGESFDPATGRGGIEIHIPVLS